MPISKNSLILLGAILIAVALYFSSMHFMRKSQLGFSGHETYPKNPPPEAFVVKTTADGFLPNSTEIYQGETIVFDNVDTKPHWPASNIHPTHQVYPEFDPQKAIADGATWSFTFERPGEWRFHDHIYPEFIGVIMVKSRPGDIPTQDGVNLDKPSTIQTKEQVNKKIPLPMPDKNLDLSFTKANISTIAKNEDNLKYWIRNIGPKKVMEKLLADSGEGSTLDCHQEAHTVGKIAYEIYGGSAFIEGSAACHSGYYHGAIETFLKEEGTENLSVNVQRICNIFGTGFGRFECLHGIGHGVLAYEDYDLPKALDVCGQLDSDYNTSSCYGGMFMENIIAGQGLGAIRGHGTKWVGQDPQFPCNSIDQKHNVQYQCYQMQTSWMLTLYKYDFDKVISECQKVREDMTGVCFKSLGRDAAGHTLRNHQKIKEICAKVSKENDYYDQCVIGAVNVIVDFWGDGLKEQASDFCRILPQEGKNSCYTTLSWRLTDLFNNSADKQVVCSSFEPDYQNLCRHL